MGKSEMPHIGARMVTVVRCYECDRMFDLMKDADAQGYYYGHDCEEVSVRTKTEYINRAMDKLS